MSDYYLKKTATEHSKSAALSEEKEESWWWWDLEQVDSEWDAVIIEKDHNDM